MATPNIPVVNAGELYLTGLGLSNDATSATTLDTIVTIATGQCRDSTNANDITVSSALSVDNTVSGAGGLDTGSVAATTFYAVFVIGDSTGYNSPAGLMSTSATAPALPVGYDMFRRLGWVKTDGSSDNLEFDQRGAGKDRATYYRTAIATDITAGTSTSFAAVNVSASVPAASLTGIFAIALTPTGADDQIDLRCGDSTVDAAQATMSGSAAGVVKRGNLVCPIGATLASGVDYKITAAGSAAINVQGYIDQL